MSQDPANAQRKLHVILCEGFDDRAFLGGWLDALGCSDPTDRGKRRIPDVYGRQVSGRGRFLFETAKKSSVILRPYHGRSKLLKAVRDELKDHATYPISRLVLNLDSDSEDADDAGDTELVRSLAANVGGELRESDSGFHLDGIDVSTVVWQCDDEPRPGLPTKQTLERLVSAAIRAAYDGRGEAVERWLEMEPRAEVGPKSYGFSYLAKWYADSGADDFYRALWRDEKVAAELRQRLETAGGWAAVEALVGD